MKSLFRRPTRTCKRCKVTQNYNQFMPEGCICITCKRLAVEKRDKRKQIIKDRKGRPKLHKPIA